MAFSIKNPEADRLVRELAAPTGESLTTAVTESVRQRLKRERLLIVRTKAGHIREVLEHSRRLERVENLSSLPQFDAAGLPV